MEIGEVVAIFWTMNDPPQTPRVNRRSLEHFPPSKLETAPKHFSNLVIYGNSYLQKAFDLIQGDQVGRLRFLKSYVLFPFLRCSKVKDLNLKDIY